MCTGPKYKLGLSHQQAVCHLPVLTTSCCPRALILLLASSSTSSYISKPFIIYRYCFCPLLLLSSQEPLDEALTDSLPAINCWYASQIGDTAPTAPADAAATPAAAPPGPTPPPAATPADPEELDFFTQDAPPSEAPVEPTEPAGTPAVEPVAATPAPSSGSPTKVVYAGWLAPPPMHRWDTRALADEPDLRRPLDQMLQPGPSAAAFEAGAVASAATPEAAWSVAQHWVRPGMLAAAFVSEAGQLTLWWATMGR